MSAARRTAIAALFLATTFTLPAHAVSKEMIQLQQQIQDLQNAVAKLQQSNDERMGVLKDLVQQTADSVNRMSVTVGSLQQHMQILPGAHGRDDGIAFRSCELWVGEYFGGMEVHDPSSGGIVGMVHCLNRHWYLHYLDAHLSQT